MPYAFRKTPEQTSLRLSYENAANGNYRRRPESLQPLSYFANRGANVSTNEFWDPKLAFGESHIANIGIAIDSAMRNGFTYLYLTMREPVYLAITNQLASIAANRGVAVSIMMPCPSEAKFTLFADFSHTWPE